MVGALQIYGLKQCSTCVKARRWLDGHNVAYHFIDYRQEPVDSGLLLQWSGMVGGWERLVNRASMTWRNLPDARKSPASDADWLDLVGEFPTLIKRPVMVRSGKVLTLGFSEKKYDELLGA